MTSQIYNNNRKQLISKLTDADIILIAGNGQVSRSGDTAYRFRQDSNMIYLSGINAPASSLLIDVKLGKSYIIVPKISKQEEIFEGKLNLQSLLDISGTDDILPEEKALQIVKESKNFYMNLPPKQLYFGVYSNPNRERWVRRIKRLGIKPKDARPALAELRMVKQAYEIKNIQKAIEITKQTLSVIEKNIKSFSSETEIANKITSEFALRGVEHAYLPIVASGHKAAILHHQPGVNPILSNNCLLFDVGAEFNNYSADISRTLLIGQNKLVQNIINDIKKAQTKIIAYIKPGLTWQELQKYSNQQIEAIILKHKLGTNKDVQRFFPHSVGHFIGLDTHDAGNYKLPLQAGMIITIEPGLYDVRKGLGVRIEDEVLITADGAQRL